MPNDLHYDGSDGAEGADADNLDHSQAVSPRPGKAVLVTHIHRGRGCRLNVHVVVKYSLMYETDSALPLELDLRA